MKNNHQNIESYIYTPLSGQLINDRSPKIGEKSGMGSLSNDHTMRAKEINIDKRVHISAEQRAAIEENVETVIMSRLSFADNNHESVKKILELALDRESRLDDFMTDLETAINNTDELYDDQQIISQVEDIVTSEEQESSFNRDELADMVKQIRLGNIDAERAGHDISEMKRASDGEVRDRAYEISSELSEIEGSVNGLEAAAEYGVKLLDENSEIIEDIKTSLNELRHAKYAQVPILENIQRLLGEMKSNDVKSIYDKADKLLSQIRE